MPPNEDDDLALPCEHKFRSAKFACWTTGAAWSHDVATNSQLESDVEYGVYFVPRKTVKAVCGVCEGVVSDLVNKLSKEYTSMLGSEAVNSVHATNKSETQPQVDKLLTRLIMKTPYLSTAHMKKNRVAKMLKFQKTHSHWPSGRRSSSVQAESTTNSSPLSKTIDAVARQTCENSTTTTDISKSHTCGKVKYSPTVVEQTLTANPSMPLQTVASLLCMNFTTLSKIMLTHKLSRMEELKSKVHASATYQPTESVSDIEQLLNHDRLMSKYNNNITDDADDYDYNSATKSVVEKTVERPIQTRSVTKRKKMMNNIDAVVEHLPTTSKREGAADAKVAVLDQSSNSEIEKSTTKAKTVDDAGSTAEDIIDADVSLDIQKLPPIAQRIYQLLQPPVHSTSEIAMLLNVKRSVVKRLIAVHNLRQRVQVAKSNTDADDGGGSDDDDNAIDDDDPFGLEKMPLMAQRIHWLLQAPEYMSMGQMATLLEVPRSTVHNLVSIHKLRRSHMATSFSDIPLAVPTKKAKIDIVNTIDGMDAVSNNQSPSGIREDEANAKLIVAPDQSSGKVGKPTTKAVDDAVGCSAKADVAIGNGDADAPIDIGKLPATARRILRLLRAREYKTVGQIAAVLKVRESTVKRLMAIHKLRRRVYMGRSSSNASNNDHNVVAGDLSEIEVLPLMAQRIHRLLQAPEYMSKGQIATELEVPKSVVKKFVYAYKLRRTVAATSFSDIPLAVTAELPKLTSKTQAPLLPK